jgi:hypothetical protein
MDRRRMRIGGSKNVVAHSNDGACVGNASVQHFLTVHTTMLPRPAERVDERTWAIVTP